MTIGGEANLCLLLTSCEQTMSKRKRYSIYVSYKYIYSSSLGFTAYNHIYFYTYTDNIGTVSNSASKIPKQFCSHHVDMCSSLIRLRA